MGDGGGSSRPGVCKWHPRPHGEGVCAICLRTSLEKLAAYQRAHHEPAETYSGAFSSTSVAGFSRERDNSGQSFQPSYPSVSYRSRSKKESKAKGGSSSQDGSTFGSRKAKVGSGAKSKLSWGVAVHRIASIRSAFMSLWKSDSHPEEKRKQGTGVRDKHGGRVHGQSGMNEVEGKEKLDNRQYSGHSEKPRALAESSGRVNGESKRNSTSSSPWTGSSSFVSKFTQRSGNPEESRMRWLRSKSSREGKRDADVHLASNDGPRTPDGNLAYDAPSPCPAVPHPSSKASPWMFFSRSGSRRSPLKVDTPKRTPRRSVGSDSRAQRVMTSELKSYLLSRGPSPKPDAVVPMSKSALSSPLSRAKQDPHSQTSLGSKSSSWSRTLSPSSSKPSPLYLAPRTMEIHGDSPSRGSLDAQEEFHDRWKPVLDVLEIQTRRDSESQKTWTQGSEVAVHMSGRRKASVGG